MKNALPIVTLALAVGVVLGFLLGGIGPRRELADTREELADKTDQLSDALNRSGGWRAPIPGLDRVLRGPEEPPEPAREAAPIAEDPERGESIATEDPDAGIPAEPPPSAVEERWSRRSPEERRERFMSAFDRASSVQDVRRVQSRAALLEQANLSEEETAQVDEALAAMNEELVGYGEEVIQLVFSDVAPKPRDLLGISHDVTGILSRAQSSLEDVVGDRADGVDSGALEIWNYIAIEDLRPMAEAAADGT